MSSPAPDDSRCQICGAAVRKAFEATVLGQHRVGYFFCDRCQHLRTQRPFWLPQAYSSAIARADTGLVMRNLKIARYLACILFEFCDRDGRFLDLAGGTGLLTRLMRDVGFDTYWEDAYCVNQMAAGFEAAAGSAGYEAVTAFEALEHMEDPLGFIESAVARSRTGTLVFTTELFEAAPPPADWWYYAFPTGQHISFFTRVTLDTVAARLGLRLLSAKGMHLLTRLDIDERQYARVLKKSGRGLYEKVCESMQSRTQADHDRMLNLAQPAKAP
jgi:hypothetical protein